MSATMREQRGIATLGIVLGVLLVITLGAIFTAQLLLREQKAAANEYRAIQAAEAAEAGLEWGMAQLSVATFASQTIVDEAPQDGFVDANTVQAPAGLLPVTVGFQVSFSNPVVNNLKLLTVTSVGCADGCSPCNTNCPVNRVVQMRVTTGTSLFPQALRASLIAKNQVSLSLNEKVTNAYTNQPGSDLTVWSGGSATYSNGSGTVSATGSYNTASSDPNTRQNDGALASASVDAFFQLFFSGTQAEIKSTLPNIACGTDCNAQLNGIHGQALWITTPLVLTENNVIGSLTSPVILITTQDCQISPNNQIYGVIYCNNFFGTGTGTKSSVVYGGIIAQNNFSVIKVPDIIYTPAVMTALTNQFSSGGGGGRVPGSWRDFL
ncbi:MAG: hypothetical protein HQL90_00160 [Magnetococcales bacterium]|nr:hypothetical protein [Magnetococcales bacterium]